MKSLNFNPDNMQWELAESTPYFRRWISWIGPDSYVQKTEYLGDAELLEANRQDYDDSFGKKFGDNPRVASIPLNVLYSSQHQLMEKMQEGDKDHLKWWLNREENKQYRTFRGKI